MQTKLAAQIPSFIQALENLPNGLPNIHIAVVSSDLGAPGDSTSVTCTTAGDQGLFRLSPGCASSTLAAGETYVSNVGGNANYTGNLADVLACITPLGDTGCGFGHQLGSIARALGADGAPAPARNAGFLRPGADLAIIILSNADDCSAPPTTYVYSINNGQNNLTNALRPADQYRCNEFGHLCIDPSGDPPKLIQPPETAPLDAPGAPSAPTLTLTDCESLDTDGLLTPVSTLVSGIKALKADPDNQIFVGAIVAPPTPYTVDWVAPVGGQNLRPGELWPQIEHSCGSGDGSFGDPAVRITQLVKEFGANGVSTSICDPSASYASLLSGLAAKIGDHLQEAASSDHLRRGWLGGGRRRGHDGRRRGCRRRYGRGRHDRAHRHGRPPRCSAPAATAEVDSCTAAATSAPPGRAPRAWCWRGCSCSGPGGAALRTAPLAPSKADRKFGAAWTDWRATSDRRLSACKETSCPSHQGPSFDNVHPARDRARGGGRVMCAAEGRFVRRASAAAVTAAATGTSPGNLDVLFMIDNSSSMTVMQQKLASQIPGVPDRAAEPPDGAPQHSHRRRLVGHGRAG